MSWDGQFCRCDVCNSPWGDVFILDPGQPTERVSTLCAEHEVTR